MSALILQLILPAFCVRVKDCQVTPPCFHVNLPAEWLLAWIQHRKYSPSLFQKQNTPELACYAALSERTETTKGEQIEKNGGLKSNGTVAESS